MTAKPLAIGMAMPAALAEYRAAQANWNVDNVRVVQAILSAAAPSIVAAELERMADQISPDSDPADEEEQAYDDGCTGSASQLRKRAKELRGGK